MPIVINMKKFILLLLLTQCSFANELSSVQHKAELASLELMAEIKAEMGVTECVWPDDKLIFSEYHSSLSSILLDYQKVSQ